MRITHLSQRRRRTAATLLAASLAVTATGLVAGPAHAAGSPDLVVTAVSPVMPGTQATGSDVVFKATIKNQGTAATAAGTVLGVAFAVNGRTMSWSDTSTASLAPGASRTVTANSGPDGDATWTATTGSYTLRARVDDVRRVAESNESNNDRTASLAATPVKAPTDVTARPAVDQDTFDLAHARTVRVSWSIPSGQPVGVRYTVTEHPVYEDGGWCGTQLDADVATSFSTTATFDMTTGRDCPNHADGYRDTYSVRAVPPAGAATASSGRTGECTWWRDNYTQFTEYSFDCGGVLLYDSLTGGSHIDAGADQDSPGWEKDQGFTGGSTYTSSASNLYPPLTTSRWGFTKYTLHTAPGTHYVAIRMVEPTFKAAGKRVFDLRVNGELVAEDLDIFAEVGRNQEHVIWTEVEAPDGVIEVVPTKKVDNPIVAAISVG